MHKHAYIGLVAGHPPSAHGNARWELYRLLADATRVRLLALASIEELAVSEMAELLREGQPKVSRHAALLRDADLLRARRQGTWQLLRAAEGWQDDAVVADAVEAGLASCKLDGTIERVAEVVSARDAATREFFARGGRPVREGPPEELGAYVAALGALVWPRRLAIDVGCGDGALLEVLAPVFDRVVAVDRSEAQLSLARRRAERRGFANVRFVCGPVDGPEVRRALRLELAADARQRAAPSADGADAVFASRILHHAPRPLAALEAMVALARPPARNDRPAASGPRPAAAGVVVILDYEAHRDESLREQQADLWLGFAPAELCAMAERAGLVEVRAARLPAAFCGEGPDRHLRWQLVAGRRATGRSAHAGSAGSEP